MTPAATQQGARGWRGSGRLLGRAIAELELLLALVLSMLVLASFFLPDWCGRSGTAEAPAIGCRMILALRSSVVAPGVGALVAMLCGAALGAALALWRGPLERVTLHLRAMTDFLPRVLLFLIAVSMIPSLQSRLLVFPIFALVLVPSVAMSVRNTIFSVFTRAQIKGLQALPLSSRELVVREILWRGCRWSLVDILLGRFGELVALEAVLSFLGQFRGMSLGGMLGEGISGNHAALVLLALVVYLPLRMGIRIESWGRAQIRPLVGSSGSG